MAQRGRKPALGSTRPPKVDPRFAKPKEVRVKTPKQQVPFWIRPSLFPILDELAQMEGRNRTNYLERMIEQAAEREGLTINKDLDYELPEADS